MSTATGPDPFDQGSAAPGTGSAGFSAELASDPLGIVASYLPQSDQLIMRQAGDAVRRAVDATLRSLTLTGREACDLLAEPDAFRHLGELRLTRCNDDDLVALADLLRHGARPAFDLVLDRDAGVEVGAAGLRALAPLNLSGIVLRGLAVPCMAALALSESRAPVSIALPFFSDDGSNPYWISQIPALTCLNAGSHALSVATVDALRSHPCLTTLSAAGLSADALRKLAGNTGLQSLSVINGVSGDNAQAFAALADSTTLTSLVVDSVTRAEDIATLARSRTISALTLHLDAAGTASGFPALATMPALAHLTLMGIGMRIPVASEDIAAVCGKPLKSLNLSTLQLDAAAFAQVAAAHAGSLTWEDGRAITDLEAVMLAANPHLSSLSLGLGMVSRAAALLLARAPGLAYLDIGYASTTPVVSRQLVTNAWTTVGKTLADLLVDVYDDDEDEAVPLWA